MLNWLIHSQAGLLTRLFVGVGIFAVLAVVDLRRKGPNATRWREYCFLLIATIVAMAYGVINDQITSRISWEYFYYGKDLESVLGPTTPPDEAALSWQAVRIGVEATWSAGIISGVAMLIANNPRKSQPRLRYRRLLLYLPFVFGITAVCGVIFGILGYHGQLNFLSQDFAEMARADIFRPRRFLCTWGIHLGGYLGGVLGTIISVIRIVHLRKVQAFMPGPGNTPHLHSPPGTV